MTDALAFQRSRLLEPPVAMDHSPWSWDHSREAQYHSSLKKVPPWVLCLVSPTRELFVLVLLPQPAPRCCLPVAAFLLLFCCCMTPDVFVGDLAWDSCVDRWDLVGVLGAWKWFPTCVIEVLDRLGPSRETVMRRWRVMLELQMAFHVTLNPEIPRSSPDNLHIDLTLWCCGDKEHVCTKLG